MKFTIIPIVFILALAAHLFINLSISSVPHLTTAGVLGISSHFSEDANN